MAGGITISTLNDDTGVLATQNGMTGIAKAWVMFSGAGSTSINKSFNVSSVTYNTMGQYTVNFTTAFPDANYAIAGSAGNSDNASRWFVQQTTKSTTACLVRVFNGSNATDNASMVSAIFFS